MVAASNKAEKCVKYLRSHFINQVDADGKTALIYALEAGSQECAEMLLDEAGCQKCKFSPLITAVRAGLFSMIGKLIGYVNSGDENGITCLMLICRMRKYEYIDTFIEEAGCQDADGICASMILAEQGAFQELQKLYFYENMLVDNSGATVMHYACRSGNLDMIKFLYPTFEFAEDDEGIPPVHYAIREDFINIAQYFEQYEGARCDNYGRTELMVAAEHNAF